MKKTLTVFFVVSLMLVSTNCKNSAPKSFGQCKIKGLTLINAEADEKLNGNAIKEFSPVPPKIILRLAELPTRRIMFLIDFDPADCADSINGKVEIAEGGESALSKNTKPFVLLGFARTDFWGNIRYTAGEMETGLSEYELTPRFLKNAENADGERLRFELEVVE